MSSASTPSPTGSSQNANSNGPTSSPLLFFVALGFGVVFTNLWIIVGVKYCFRYNRRRAAAANGEIDPIDLAAMPRPHRRRREKKLMSMDDVNTRFPLTKYKTWKSSREMNGLPTSGGIATAPQSRPASIKHVEAILPESNQDACLQSETALSKAHDDLAALPSTPKTTSPRTSIHDKVPDESPEEKQCDSEKAPETSELVTTSTVIPRTEDNSHGGHGDDNENENENEDDNEDDDTGTDADNPIATAIVPETVEPGDICAICIETLEDDEDIRGLTCGHAFHASCVDPWLTSRRACCPLCKADYYIPKPRPEGETHLATGRRPSAGLSSSQDAWSTTRSNPLLRRSRVFIIHNSHSSQPGTRIDPFGRLSRPSRPARGVNPSPSTWRSRFHRNRGQGPTFPSWFGRRHAASNESSAAPPSEPTPGQLEAGNR